MSCKTLQDQLYLNLCFITGDMEAGNLDGWVAEICRDNHQVMSGQRKEDIRSYIRLKTQRENVPGPKVSSW